MYKLCGLFVQYRKVLAFLSRIRWDLILLKSFALIASFRIVPPSWLDFSFEQICVCEPWRNGLVFSSKTKSSVSSLGSLVKNTQYSSTVQRESNFYFFRSLMISVLGYIFKLIFYWLFCFLVSCLLRRYLLAWRVRMLLDYCWETACF